MRTPSKFKATFFVQLLFVLFSANPAFTKCGDFSTDRCIGADFAPPQPEAGADDAPSPPLPTKPVELHETEQHRIGHPSASNQYNLQSEASPSSNSNEAKWVDAFSRRGYKLGMSLSQFRRVHYPDQREWPGAFPLCSGDHVPANSYVMDRTWTQSASANPYSDVGVIRCVFVYNSQHKEKQFWETDAEELLWPAGLMLGSASVRNEFYFIKMAENSEPVLFLINCIGNQIWYPSVLGEFKARYGEPHLEVNQVQNGFGATFQNETWSYHNGSSSIWIKKYTESLDTFKVAFMLADGINLLTKLQQEQQHEQRRKNSNKL